MFSVNSKYCRTSTMELVVVLLLKLESATSWSNDSQWSLLVLVAGSSSGTFWGTAVLSVWGRDAGLLSHASCHNWSANWSENGSFLNRGSSNVVTAITYPATSIDMKRCWSSFDKMWSRELVVSWLSRYYCWSCFARGTIRETDM